MLVLSTKLNCQPIDAVNTTESPLVVNSRFIHNNLTGGFMRWSTEQGRSRYISNYFT